jgi:BarA-like signal transduction histidine kinase
MCYVWQCVAMCDYMLLCVEYVFLYVAICDDVFQCAMWLYVAMCESMLPCATIYDNVLLCVTKCFNVPCMTMRCYVWQYVAMCDNVLFVAICDYMLLCVTICFNVLCMTMCCYLFRCVTIAPFTLRSIFGTARIKLVPLPLFWFLDYLFS